MADYRIEVAKSELGFAAGHFITYGGGRCERLHGHNYRVGVQIAGRLNEDALVYDFVTLKRMVASLVADLDHRMLIQTENRLLSVEADEGEVRVLHGERTYLFPRRDVALLPIENTTAELLAEYLAGQLMDEMGGQANLTEIAVEVEESPGQSATFRQPLTG
jgi:6-pyruvoyltetrahydropterin/6-carboxytetrahydropterin synthase